MGLEPGNLPKKGEITVLQVCGLFLDSACPYVETPRKKPDRRKGERPPALRPNPPCHERTYWWYRSFLEDFCGRYGKLLAKDLMPFHVSNWLKAHAGWNSSRRNAVIAVKRAFSWASQEGVFEPNPIKGVKKPPASSRPTMLTKEERREILDTIQDVEFRSFVEAMQETGARPSEISRLTADAVNLRLGVCVLRKHKTVNKTGKPRVIYMTPRFVAIVTPLIQTFPEGPLFRGPRLGKAFGMHGICSRFRRLRKKLPHLKHAVAYAIRHGFAAEALNNGVPIALVAELLGHRDCTMVATVYGHLADQVSHMREAAMRATGV
jgi:integrase